MILGVAYYTLIGFIVYLAVRFNNFWLILLIFVIAVPSSRKEGDDSDGRGEAG